MKSINTYDLGKTTDSLRAVKIDELVRKARDEFKDQFIKSRIDINGKQIEVTTTNTRFGGRRIWFICPICKDKKGVIYADPILGCRICLNLKYKKQRYRRMIEMEYVGY